jgi:hypothetical protein
MTDLPRKMSRRAVQPKLNQEGREQEMNQENEKLNLNLDDLNLGELQELTEEASYALPEAGASSSPRNSCTIVIPPDAA